MKIQPYKEIALMKLERASAPEVTCGKNRLTDNLRTTRSGSVTVEAAFGIPLFLFAVLCLIWLIELQSIRFTVANAAQNAAKSAAEETAVIPVLNVWKMRSDIVDLIGEDRLDRSIVKGGISCIGSYVSPVTGEMNIKVTYRVELPLPVMGLPSAEQEHTFKLSAWTGYMNGGEDGREADIVYVTDNAAVYHEDYQCSYLHLSIRSVVFDDVAKLRNEGGGKYHACEKCVYNLSMGNVYITDTGNKYHNSLNCSGLKRTIHAVKREEVRGMGGCSRCVR